MVKNKVVENHIAHLVEMFITLKEYRMNLNPKKCVFNVSFGKFLGYVMTQCEIEMNHDKIKALTNMESP